MKVENYSTPTSRESPSLLSSANQYLGTAEPNQTRQKGAATYGSKDSQRRIELMEKAFSASVGAFITSLVVTPLDVIKVRMQAQHQTLPSRTGESLSTLRPTLSNLNGRTLYVFCSRFYDHVEPCECRTLYVFERPAPLQRLPITGTLDGVLQISRHEGVTSLWRGLSPTLVMSVPAMAIYLVGYEAIKDSMTGSVFLRKHLPVAQDPLVAPLVAGSLARIAAVSLISPVELMKTQMQHRIGQEGRIASVAGMILSGVRREGIGVLYKGLVPTLWRDVPFSGIYWAAFEQFRHLYRKLLPDESASSHFLVSFMSGASSGMIAASLTTPFDVAKTRQQVQSLHQSHHSSHPPHTNGIARHLLEIWRTEGIAGLTRGIVPRICKVAPSCAIMVGSYEFGKRYLSSQRSLQSL